MFDRLARWIAWKLPRDVVRWAFIRATAYAAQGRWSKTLVPGLAWDTIIRRWELGDGPCCPCDPSLPDATCKKSCDCDDWCCPPVGVPLVPEGAE